MNNKTVTIILICLALAIIPVYWLQLAFRNPIIRDGLYLSTVIAAVIAGLFALSKYGLKSPRRITLLAFTSGLTGSLISELIFEYHYIILKHDIPFPSIGDFFALIFYVLFFIGLINEIRLANIHWEKLNKKILILPVLISIVLICVVSYMGIYKAYDPTMDLFGNIVSMAYGVGDLTMIIISMFLLVLVKEYQGGRFARIWLFLLIGFMCSITADIFWSFYPNEYHDEVWFYKSFFDTFAMLGYLFMAKMLFDYGFSIVDAIKIANSSIADLGKPLTLKDTSIKNQEQ